jgi:hypothetical protein
MLLPRFLVRRVVEVIVHGLELSEALGRESWLISQAADLVQGLLGGPDRTWALEKLECDQLRFYARRQGTTQASEEALGVSRRGIQWLTLG